MIEEVLFVKEEVIKNVIAPVFGKEGTKLIALSSPEISQDNGFSLALQKNKHLFETIHITYVCEECVKLKIATICKHRWLEVPAWQTAESLKVAKALMDDDETVFARENLGLVVDDGRYVFNTPLITYIFEAAKTDIVKQVPFVFVSIDPCAGSMIPEKGLSDFAIVSFIPNPKTVVGLDSFPSGDHKDYLPRVIAHIEKLKQNEFMKHAYFVIDVENNSDTLASIIYDKVMDHFPGCIIPFSSHPNTAKIGNSIQTKEKTEMVHLAQQYINERSICFFRDYSTTNPKQNRDRYLDLKELQAQCLRLERQVDITSKGVAKNVRYTGKAGNKKDDLVITFMRVMHTAKRFFQMQHYAGYWGGMGTVQQPGMNEEELAEEQYFQNEEMPHLISAH